jgi:hypothetical protein
LLELIKVGDSKDIEELKAGLRTKLSMCIYWWKPDGSERDILYTIFGSANCIVSWITSVVA